MGDPFFPDGRRAALSLTFDDARLSQADVGLDLLDRAQTRATFYVSPANVEQRLERWRSAVAAGHEIGNHTVSHPCTGNFPWSRSRAVEEMSLAQMDRELTGANEVIRQLLGVTPRTYAYPCGLTYVGRGLQHMSYVPLVAKHFVAGRLFRSEASNDPAFCDLAHLFAVEGDNCSFEQYKVLVDAAIEQGQWLVFAGHEIGEAGRQTTLVPALKELCRYCEDCQDLIWVDTVDKVASHIASLRTRQELKPCTV